MNLGIVLDSKMSLFQSRMVRGSMNVCMRVCVSVICLVFWVGCVTSMLIVCVV